MMPLPITYADTFTPPVRAQKALERSIRLGDMTRVDKALAQGAQLTFQNCKPIQQVAHWVTFDFFFALMERAGVTDTSTWDKAAQNVLLRRAVEHNDIPSARAALAAGAHTGWEDGIFPGVWRAVQLGYWAMAYWLWAQVAEVDRPRQADMIAEAAIEQGHLGWLKQVFAYVPQSYHQGDFPRLLNSAIEHRQPAMVAYLEAQGLRPAISTLCEAIRVGNMGQIHGLMSRLDWWPHQDHLWHWAHDHPNPQVMDLFAPLQPWVVDWLGQDVRSLSVGAALTHWNRGHRTEEPVTVDFVREAVARYDRDPKRLGEILGHVQNLDPDSWSECLADALRKGRAMRTMLVETRDLTPALDHLAAISPFGSPRKRRRDCLLLEWVVAHVDLQRDRGRTLQALAFHRQGQVINRIWAQCDLEAVRQAFSSGEVSLGLKHCAQHPRIESPYSSEAAQMWQALDFLGCHVDAHTRQKWATLHGGNLPQTVAKSRQEDLAQRPSGIPSRTRARS